MVVRMYHMPVNSITRMISSISRMASSITRTTVTGRAPKGSKDLEAFLFLAVQRELIDHVFTKGGGYKLNLKSEKLKVLCKNLQDRKMVTIPADKTNYFKCILDIRDYIDWAIKHLLKSRKEIPRSKLVQVLEEANILLESLKDTMSENE